MPPSDDVIGSRRPRGPSRLAWTALALMIVIALGEEAYGALSGRGTDPFVVAMLTFPAVGVVVVTRQPRNAVGWILLAIGAVWTAPFEPYANVGLQVTPLPGAAVALALGAPLWIPGVGLIGPFLLLFPDGHLPSPRWRPVLWWTAAALTLCYCVFVVSPDNFADNGFPQVGNPLALDVLAAVPWLFIVVLVQVPLSIVACAMGLVGRFRCSRGQERLQLKWLTTAAAVAAAVYLIAIVAHLPFIFSDRPPPGWVLALEQVGVLPFVLIPLAAGVAILRYRLYDIDVIINRALVYGALTSALTATYVAVVTVLQLVLAPVSGRSDLAVAASTLAVAALFRPALVRIQRFIDRRFYRRRYNAVRTLEGFSARLRADVDVGTIAGELDRVVRDVVGPAHLSLWLPATAVHGATWPDRDAIRT